MFYALFPLESDGSFLLVSHGWSMEERLEGAWRKAGGGGPSAWSEIGRGLERNGAGKRMIAGERRLFHGLFHGKAQNVSERSLTFCPCP